ncbi:MAG: glycosyltransferase family 2 protein [Flavipsychrobacter sp.]|nr:glycosyltransferase family 2 protein [Flavipsychrobacter sp.]
MYLSVVVITYNEERNLGRCLASVNGVADEIIVVDSNSTDRTVQIAKDYGATVIQQAFLGYGGQKNFANEQATNNWILSLDADEALTPELKNSILKVKENPVHNAYRFSRFSNYCGAWIKHSGWYPDIKVRLFNRNKGAWKSEKVHEYWELNDNTEKVGDLKGDLLHYTYYTISEQLKQIDKYTELAALDAAERGKDCSIIKIWLVPKWTFISHYFFKLGFLDGYAGYLVCKYIAYYTFIKYSKIRFYARKGVK